MIKCLRETRDENIAKKAAANSSLKHVVKIRPDSSNSLSASDWVAVAFVSKHLKKLASLWLIELPTVQCSLAAKILLKERCIETVILGPSSLDDLSLEHLLNALMASECHVDHEHSKLHIRTFQAKLIQKW